jgi:hypothetical protein
MPPSIFVSAISASTDLYLQEINITTEDKCRTERASLEMNLLLVANK